MGEKLVHPESREYAREASKALRHHNLPGGFRERIEKEEGVEMIGIRNSTPIPLKSYPVAGQWTLHMAWTVRRDPAGGDSVLWRSSIGLNVRGVPFAPTRSTCLVRYDVDMGRTGPNLAPLGAHLNVLQPEPLGDRLHFPVLAADRRWTAREVIDLFLSSEFTADMSKCIGTP
jgi:hypothetical protein